jgi:hypothetical protein
MRWLGRDKALEAIVEADCGCVGVEIVIGGRLCRESGSAQIVARRLPDGEPAL